MKHVVETVALIALAALILDGGPGALAGTKKGSKPGKEDKAAGKGGKSAEASTAGEDPVLAEAIKHFEKGVAFFDKKKYGAALAEFLRSYELAPNFELRYNIGFCYMKTGKLIEALDEFQAYLKEGEDKVSAKVRSDVEEMIAEIMDKMGNLVIEVNEQDATIIIDDTYTYTSPLSGPLAVPAGLHSVVVKKKGFDRFTREVTVATGQTKSVKVTLSPLAYEAPHKAADKGVGKGKDLKVDDDRDETEGSGPEKKRAWPLRGIWVALGAGGALAVGTAVTGGLVLKKKDEMEEAIDGCTNTMTREDCPAAYEASDEGTSLKIASNVLAGAAGAAALAGFILFILDNPKLKEKRAGKGKGGGEISVFPYLTPVPGKAGPGVGAGAVLSF